MKMIMWSNFSLWTLNSVLERERIGGVHRTVMIIIQSVLRHGFGNIVMVDSQLSLSSCSRYFCCTSSCRCSRTSEWCFNLNLVYSGMWHCAVCFIVPAVLHGDTIFLWHFLICYTATWYHMPKRHNLYGHRCESIRFSVWDKLLTYNVINSGTNTAKFQHV